METLKKIKPREDICPLCGSTLFLKNLKLPDKKKIYSFDVHCCGVGCIYTRHFVRKLKERKQENG